MVAAYPLGSIKMGIAKFESPGESIFAVHERIKSNGSCQLSIASLFGATQESSLECMPKRGCANPSQRGGIKNKREPRFTERALFP